MDIPLSAPFICMSTYPVAFHKKLGLRGPLSRFLTEKGDNRTKSKAESSIMPGMLPIHRHHPADTGQNQIGVGSMPYIGLMPHRRVHKLHGVLHFPGQRLSIIGLGSIM